MASDDFSGFKPSLLKFLRELENNNNREWFAENKHRYETLVLEPALDFIAAMGKPLRQISTRFSAIPKRSGGSLMRVYRDTRFSKDKTPYKTNVGIQFRHELGKDVHAPGYYLHIEPGQVFVGAGLWRPDPAALGRIRDAIVADPGAWRRIRSGKAFGRHFELAGKSLVRPPRGYDAAHPLIEDLKRKDFIAVENLSDKDLVGADFLARVSASFKAATPLMKFLCESVEVRF